MKWFYIDIEGNIQFLGVFDTIEDADDVIMTEHIVANYILSERTAKQWAYQLNIHLGI